MTDDQAWEAMAEGKRVRRPTWREGYYMVLEDGIEHTYDSSGICLSMGFRKFTNETLTDWEILE